MEAKFKHEQAASTSSDDDNASSEEESPPLNCYWAKTAFYTHLNDAKEGGYNYSRVAKYFSKRNTKKYGMIDILKEADVIFIPMNLGEMHWALGVIHLKEHAFRVYDSMNDGA